MTRGISAEITGKNVAEGRDGKSFLIFVQCPVSADIFRGAAIGFWEERFHAEVREIGIWRSGLPLRPQGAYLPPAGGRWHGAAVTDGGGDPVRTIRT